VRAGGARIETETGLTRLAVSVALIVVPVSAGLLRLALVGWNRPEIRLDI
jgi:hypothetical protein